MSELPLASIIITSYNYARYLAEAIDSALNQTYPNTEVIVVDDGSTDNSREVIAGYGSRIRALLKANGGQASAFNAGFGVSRGEVVCFLDSDDALLPSAVAGASRLMQEPGVVKAHWPLWEVDEEGRKTGRLTPLEELPEGDLRDRLLRGGPDSHATPPTSGNAWARRFLEEVLPMPEPEYRICPDSYLALLAPLFGLVRRVPSPQALYRVHGRNAMRTVSYVQKKAMFEHRCGLLEAALQSQHIAIDPWHWKAAYYEWLDRIQAMAQDLAAVIPPGEPFVLVDQDEIRSELGVGAQAVPFLERGGQYWGAPEDDHMAVLELERLRRAGAAFVVFAWPAFWWLDHYARFAEHLRSSYRCVLESDRLVVFELRPWAGHCSPL